ncbi:hypothetical protein R1sor_023929 [Riccia sorocarpa]|uniref:Uncharacterized protein n=1 Tax=Riccia sorocarpa TaxID=122646 RepID=A0ABD3GP18_9MARC
MGNIISVAREKGEQFVDIIRQKDSTMQLACHSLPKSQLDQMKFPLSLDRKSSVKNGGKTK